MGLLLAMGISALVGGVVSSMSGQGFAAGAIRGFNLVGNIGQAVVKTIQGRPGQAIEHLMGYSDTQIQNSNTFDFSSMQDNSTLREFFVDGEYGLSQAELTELGSDALVAAGTLAVASIAPKIGDTTKMMLAFQGGKLIEGIRLDQLKAMNNITQAIDNQQTLVFSSKDVYGATGSSNRFAKEDPSEPELIGSEQVVEVK